jgi:NDP-sugar pyrophosphorylase family protein
MKALILAAGEGTGSRPLAADGPIPMLPVGGVPLVEHSVSLLQRHGVTHIAINLHHKPWAIVRHLGHGRRWGVRIHYSFEERLLGSAGAAKRLEWYLDESFIVLHGDVYTEMELSAMMTAHRQGGAPITLALCESDSPTGYGLVELDGRSRVRRFVEKATPDRGFSRLAVAGICVVEPPVLSGLPAERRLDFGQDVFRPMLAEGQTITGYSVTAPVIDIGTPENYQQARRLAATRATDQSQATLSSRTLAPTAHNVFQNFAPSSTD